MEKLKRVFPECYKHIQELKKEGMAGRVRIKWKDKK